VEGTVNGPPNANSRIRPGLWYVCHFYLAGEFRISSLIFTVTFRMGDMSYYVFFLSDLMVIIASGNVWREISENAL